MTKQRGRKSTEGMAVVRLASVRRPLKPPAEMPMKAKAIFAQIVGSCGAAHFREGDAQLLAQYCNAAYLAGYYAPLIGDAENAGAFKA